MIRIARTDAAPWVLARKVTVCSSLSGARSKILPFDGLTAALSGAHPHLMRAKEGLTD